MIYFNCSDMLNVRNEVGLANSYQPYNTNDKGIKRSRSPLNQTEYYKHGNAQPQGVYLPPSNQSINSHYLIYLINIYTLLSRIK
jgi:hypothetical protein